MKDTLIRQNFSINCNGTLLMINKPLVMGILNVTPDSFYDGGKYVSEKTIVEKVQQYLAEGAAIIDIGGASSKPGVTETSAEEEKSRLLPAIEIVMRNFPKAIVSVDTYRSEIAKNCIDEGASIINDISGGNFDPEMFKTIADLKVPYIMMHIQGTSQNMQQNPVYENVAMDIAKQFSAKLNQLHQLGANDVIIDVGFGFGKSVEQNYELLGHLEYFTCFHKPILVGFSRKSMVNKIINSPAKDALNGTTVLNTIALMKGAKILRVHDVKPAVEAVKIFSALPSAAQEMLF